MMEDHNRDDASDFDVYGSVYRRRLQPMWGLVYDELELYRH